MIRASAIAAAVVVVIASVVGLWFVEQEPSTDDAGLFNPVHTYLETGEMSYPIYDMYDATIVHPPTHYLILAWLMRLTGRSVEAVAVLPLIGFLALAGFLIVHSRFSVAAKFALLFAGFAGIVVWAPPSFVRPDLHQAVVWFTGLIALETGRLANWDWRRLGLGGVLIGLSSVLHYPAAASLAAVGVYGLWVLHSLGFRRARPALAALALGTGLVIVPYAALYLVPHWDEIMAFAKLVNERGGSNWLAGFEQAREQYRYLAESGEGGAVMTSLARPFLSLAVPVVCATTLLLGARRETRGLALASAPYLLFLLFYAQSKSVYYYTPEFLLYFACVAYAALLVLGAALSRFGISRHAALRAVAIVGALAVAGAVLLEPSTLRAGGERSWRPLHQDMEVARAAGAEMLPPNALVGTNDLGLWYSTGAARTHYFRFDLDPVRDISKVNLRAFLSGFDAIAEASYDNWATFNRQRQAIPAWYERGLLRVRGFYFGDRRGRPANQMGYLLLSTRELPIEGYAFRDDRIYRFRPSGRGTQVFSVAVCPINAGPVTDYTLPWQLRTPLPGTTYPVTTSGKPSFPP